MPAMRRSCESGDPSSCTLTGVYCDVCDPPEHPLHGDVWRRIHTPSKFSVMHVCGHHDPPLVTGYWHNEQGINPCAHGSIPLPRFLASFELEERDESIWDHAL